MAWTPKGCNGPGSGRGIQGRAAVNDEYGRLQSRIRAIVETLVPEQATVLVVSRGDDELLEFDGPQGLHFPQAATGGYAGYHPADSAAAISHLEELRAAGADHLVLPSTTFWWLDHYGLLADHLQEHYRAIVEHDDCLVFSLSERAVAGAGGFRPAALSLRRAPRPELERVALALLPRGASVAVLNPARESLAESMREQVNVRELHAEEVIDPQDGSLLLKQTGVEFVLIPSSSFDWLDSRPDVRRALTGELTFVTRQRNVCELYSMRDGHG
jgi:hypothetical protein